MNSLVKATIIAIALFVVGCGSNSSTPVPAPTDPTPGTKTLPTTTTTQNPNLPDLSRAVALNLTDKTNYQGLQDLAHNVFLPLVGDPLISMSFSNTRDINISSSVLVGFEDRLGFWGAAQDNFPNLASRTSSAFDAISSDDEFSLRVVAAISGDTFTGAIYYRIRQANENQCRQVVVTCNSYGGINFGGNCSYPTPDVTTPCLTYMNTSDPAVKMLGTFKASYSAWATKTN